MMQPNSIMRGDHYDLRKSIKRCHCRLVEFFSKLDGAKRQGQGFVILQREETNRGGFETAKNPRLQLDFKADSDLTSVLVSRKANRNRLPPLASDRLKTIVLDLDETLVHSSPDPPPKIMIS
ncbi:hypothetical protein V6N11_047841 [Hibiscus sabdariffa]|uniref:FCP1 homology domain-containing protein n=1 Tax=Hibiscus sabdariffa TaxID=183260 RepID=A0ABR2P855_9ROSI